MIDKIENGQLILECIKRGIYVEPKNTIILHNLLKNPSDLPPIAEGNRHKESREVLVLYRTIEYNDETESYELEITSMGRCFYCYEDNEWYNLYDEPLCRISDMVSCGGGQEIDEVYALLHDWEYPKELVDQLTKVQTFKCEELEGEYAYTKQIIGWFEIPTYKEFIK